MNIVLKGPDLFALKHGTDEGTCNAVVPITFSSISLINNSLPLAYHITDKLRNSIFSSNAFTPLHNAGQ
jgi:hypothetical protein